MPAGGKNHPGDDYPFEFCRICIVWLRSSLMLQTRAKLRTVSLLTAYPIPLDISLQQLDPLLRFENTRLNTP